MPGYVPIVVGILAAVLVVTGLAAYFSEEPTRHRVPERPRSESRPRKKKSYRCPECVICLMQPSTMKIMPCGHTCLCSSCCLKFRGRDVTCPICRADVESIELDR